MLRCAVVTVGLIGTATASAGSTPSFTRAASYATGRTPRSLAIGDLNGDGTPDLATANIGAATVSVLLNRSGGRFRPKRDYRTGRGPASVAIGDLNGDGTPDLVTANNSASTLSVLLNKGDDTFQAKHDYRTGRGPQSVAIGDLNGDGTPDIVTANFYPGGFFQRDANSVSVLLNTGDGSFWARHDFATGSIPVSVAIGDLNGDGKPDLAIADAGAGTVSMLLNRGNGSFWARRHYAVGYDPRSVAISDLNGDGRPDLVAANYYRATGDPQHGANSVSVLLNRGDGTFTGKRDFRTGSGPISVAIGDLNGDGEPDLAIADPGPDDTPAATVSVLFNRGDGSFERKHDYLTGGRPESVAIGDLNGDGKLDLATANEDASTVSVLFNNR
jgi:FG-GAP-like repeat/FG-GAP repeat